MKTVTLEAIATVKGGIIESSDATGYEFSIIKTKDVNHETATLNLNDLDKVIINKLINEPVKSGDIIMLIRGDKNTAVLIEEDLEETIVSNHFFIIKVIPNTPLLISPKYLTWYLNVPAKPYFNAKATGRVILNLTKQVLLQLVITVPPIEVQEIVVSLWGKMLQEKKVFSELQQERELLLTSLISTNQNL